MINTPTQKQTLDEKPQERPRSILLERSSELQNQLRVQEDQVLWNEFMSKLLAEPPAPLDSSLKNPVSLHELDRSYRSLLTSRDQLALALAAILASKDNAIEVSEVQKEGVLRLMASYWSQQMLYEHLWNQSMPMGKEKPPQYLARYILIPEDVRLSLKVTETILPFQYDVRDVAGLQESPRILAPFANAIALAASRSRTSMSFIMDCLDAEGKPIMEDDPYRLFLTQVGFEDIAPQDISSAKFLVGYFGKNLEKIEQYASLSTTAGGDVRKLTIPDALESCVDVSGAGEFAKEIALRAPELLRYGIPDLRGFAKNIFENREQYPDRMVQLVLAPLSQLQNNASPDDRETFLEDAKILTEFFLGFEAQRTRVKDRQTQMGHLNQRQKDMVEKLCLQVCTPETIASLRKACFIPEDEALQTTEQKAVLHLLNSLLSNTAESTISIRQIFELHYFLSSGNGAAITLPYKVVHLLDEQGHTDVARNLQYSIFRKITDIAMSNAADFTTEIESLQLTDSQKRELSNVREYLGETGINAIHRWWENLKDFVHYYPAIAWPLITINTSGILLSVSMAVRKGWITWNISAMEHFAEMGVDEVRTQYKIPEEVSDSNILEAQKKVSELCSEYSRLNQRFHLFRGRGKRLAATAVMRALSAKDLSVMAKAIQKQRRNHIDVALDLANFAETHEELAQALKDVGYADAQIAEAMERVRSLEDSQQSVARTSFDALKQQVLKMQQADGGMSDLRTVLTEIASNRLEPTERLKKLQELQATGNVEFGDIGRIEAAIDAGVSVDLVLNQDIRGTGETAKVVLKVK